MNEYIVVPLAGILAVVIILVGVGFLILKSEATQSIRYEKCISAGMQWNEGDCLR